jgi:hypothetical protein
MEEGTIVRWLKKEGDTVLAGEPVAEIETDKVTMELEAEADGVLLKIVRRDGETVPVTETIAWLGEAGEGAGGVAAPAGSTAPATGAPLAPVPSTSMRPAAAPVPPGGRVPATPAARRLASERGVELGSVPGSGPFGAVRVRDLEKAVPAAARLSSPFAALRSKVDVTELEALVGRLISAGADLTIVHFVRKASSLALPLLGPRSRSSTWVRSALPASPLPSSRPGRLSWGSGPSRRACGFRRDAWRRGRS